MAETDPVLILENALALVYDAQSLVLRGLRANPDKDEQRRLNKTLARLKVEQKDLEDLIDAYEDEPNIMKPPPQEVVDNIAELSGKVEQEIGKNVTASRALELASGVLDMATKATA